MNVRAFVAIGLPEPTRAMLVRASDAFRSAAPEWAGEKWVPEENLHVTLKFIGSIDEERLPTVIDALAAACATLTPFTLTLDDIVAKPGGSRPRMLWATVSDGVEDSRRLAAAVDENLLAAIGLEPEKRPYTPHATLVRFRVPRRVPEAALAAAGGVLSACAPSVTVVSVPGVSLMSSRLSRTGPTYSEIASVPLRSG